MQIELNWIGFDWIYFYSIDATNYYLENMQIELNWIDFSSLILFDLPLIKFNFVELIELVSLNFDVICFYLI